MTTGRALKKSGRGPFKESNTGLAGSRSRAKTANQSRFGRGALDKWNLSRNRATVGSEPVWPAPLQTRGARQSVSTSLRERAPPRYRPARREQKRLDRRQCQSAASRSECEHRRNAASGCGRSHWRSARRIAGRCGRVHPERGLAAPDHRLHPHGAQVCGRARRGYGRAEPAMLSLDYVSLSTARCAEVALSSYPDHSAVTTTPRTATPLFSRIRFSISSAISGCARKNSRALSLPWPMRSPL